MVIFKDKQGRILTDSDLKGLSGSVNWEVRSGPPVPEEAKRLHELGRSAGQRGDRVSAIAQFEKASQLAPGWPYPKYDEAFTYLLDQQFSKALALYQQVNEVAPRGFFTVKTAVHTLRREESGQLPKGVYLAYVSLEWIGDAATRQKLITSLTERVPQFAPGWKEAALLQQDPTNRVALLDRGLASDPDDETRGFLLINKAAAYVELGKKSEAIELLGTLALDPNSPLDIELLSKRTLAQVLSQSQK